MSPTHKPIKNKQKGDCYEKNLDFCAIPDAGNASGRGQERAEN